MRTPFCLRKSCRAALVLSFAVALAGSAFAGTIGFEEDFALAPDRNAALSQLIPGTEDFYYYTTLNQQNQGQLAKADDTLKTWIKQLGRTGRVQEMENRQALLKYKADPQTSLDYLTRILGLQFNQERETLARQAALATTLDPKLISRDTLTRRALAQNPGTLGGFENTALDWLEAAKLSDGQLHELLSRLTRPDYDNLVDLVARDLATRYGTGFGSLNIHHQMLLAQLDDLVKRDPKILNDSNFVNIYLSKLRPPVGVDVIHDVKERQAYLDRMWAFVARLGSQHNSLKASILYQRLVFDRKQGVWNKDRFLAYLQLPRQVWYVSPLYLEKQSRREVAVNLNADYSTLTTLLPIRNDEPLVRSYLLHLLADAQNPDDYKPYIETHYLTEVFAEAKILAGIGDQDKWAAMLPAAKLQEIKERVELNFAYTNPELYAPEDKVAMTVNIKNVKTLIVKVYEINAANYYKTYNREVNTDINLDGLVANEEQTVTYTDSPLRRIAHEFKFDSLKGRGVYVVEFIGNGKSSRALVRKGKLRYLERDGAAGQVFSMLDEKNQRINDARLWIAGHEYTAEKSGDIVVPYSTSPGEEPVVLESGDFASLDTFHHEAEKYRLDAGIHVARESLTKYRTATVLIRPALFVNAAVADPALLENVTLSISSTDLDGVSATRDVPNFKLEQDQPTPFEFRVPERLKSVSFTLRAKVQNVSLNKKENLAFSKTFTVNEIDATEKIEDLHFSRIAGEYVIDVLGKTGEERADQPVQLMFKAHDFRAPVRVTLKSDAAGRIKLGALDGIDTITATDAEGLSRTWRPEKDDRTQMAAVHGAVGETLKVPYMGAAISGDRTAFSLLELRDGGTFVVDRFDALTVKDGFLELKGLPAGDFNLFIKDPEEQITIRIAPGEVRDERWVLSPTRFLQIKNRDPLQIVSAASDDTNLTVHLANAGKLARVEVYATRFVPDFSPLADLVIDTPGIEARTLMPQETVYESGRTIGDEYRYIIDRKYAPKYAGNMLTRPGILLNPWAIRATDTGEQEARAGGNYHGVPPENAPPGSLQQNARKYAQDGMNPAGISDDVDFLAEPAALALNLIPDAKGDVVIPRKLLGAHQDFQIVAVDPYNTVYREVSIKQPEQQIRDLRMATSLDPAKHFTEQKQISLLHKGDTITVSGASGSNLESYDTLAKVYRLYSALKPDATLQEFSFILDWPTMKDADKREKYSKYACHELNYFLYRKDPAFFENVVQPYVKNKKDKTFMDHFLLGDDLAGYAQPWAFDQLNTVERALLGQRIAAEKDRIARHMKERFDLLPPDLERFNFLFQTALHANSLAEAGKSSFATSAPAPVAASGLFANVAGEAAAGGKGGRARQQFDMAQASRNLELAQKSKEAVKVYDMRKQLLAPQDAEDQLDKDEKLDLHRRSSLRALYRTPEQTMEYVENNYYHLPIDAQTASLINVNGFWKDFAEQKPGDEFLSKNMAEPTSNFTEIMFALSALDLPFTEPAHTVKRDAGAGGSFSLTAAGPVIAYHKEIKEAQPAAEKTPILVSQNYFRQDDRYTYVDNEQTDKYLTGEFLTHVVYGCQVVITNPTSSRQKLDALLQLPKGAMPVLNSQYSRGLHLDLQPYETKAIEYAFYFPTAGEFPHYPVQVAKNEKLVASVPATTLKVVETPTKIDTTSWQYISQNGEPAQVIDYLKANNLERTNLDKIAWRMKDKDFYAQVIALLRDRHVYNNTLWSYSIKHDDPANINQFLQHQDSFVAQCGAFLDSPLLKIDPVARHDYEHMEYMPLVNARAHRLGQQRQILNNRFFEQYERTLEVLRYHPALTDEDKMAATYYLLLQDRIDEGLKMFQQVNPKNLAEHLQYDYFTAYAAFYNDDMKAARAVAEKYREYPVDRWKNLFTNVLAQADEADGKTAAVVDKLDRNQQQNALASTEPTYEFKVEAKNIILTYKNVETVKVNYYLMDIELMFSQNPFLQEYGGQFAMIKPNESATVTLDPAKGTLTIPLPDKFLTQNVMVEIVAAGQTRSQAYYANSLDVNLAENYGQLTVLSAKTGKSLPKAYVKVYARMQDGRTRFYKDGYTDPRGKFDYTSLDTNDLDNVQTFSILILSDTNGGIVRTAHPPKR